MRHPSIYLKIGACVLLCHCQGINLHHIHVADQVGPFRSPFDQQMPGTQLFARLPDGYRVDSANHKVLKSNNVFFTYAYGPGEDFKDSLTNFRRPLDSLVKERQGVFYYTKQFRMGSCPALIYYFKSIVPGQDNILLYFGDKHFTASMMAVFPALGTHDRDLLLQTLLTFYRDEDAPEDVTSLEPEQDLQP